jgi:hypothetical protein
MGSPLICASNIRITCEVHLNRFKSPEEFIQYLGQGMINLQQFEIMPRKHTTTKVDR